MTNSDPVGDHINLTRLESEELEYEFVAEQINSYIDSGLSVFVDMTPLKLSLLAARATDEGSRIKIAFVDGKIPAKPVSAGDTIRIHVLRP